MTREWHAEMVIPRPCQHGVCMSHIDMTHVRSISTGPCQIGMSRWPCLHHVQLLQTWTRGAGQLKKRQEGWDLPLAQGAKCPGTQTGQYYSSRSRNTTLGLPKAVLANTPHNRVGKPNTCLASGDYLTCHLREGINITPAPQPPLPLRVRLVHWGSGRATLLCDTEARH
jgi:hypothetical protein